MKQRSNAPGSYKPLTTPNRLTAMAVALAAMIPSAVAWGAAAASEVSGPLSTASTATVQRVSGPDRYQTAVEVARLVGGGSLTGLDRLIVVTGESFPDGLTASGLAGFLDNGGRSGRTAILLTRTATLPDATEAAIRASGVTAPDVFVVGGPSAVSDQVYTAIARAAGWNDGGANPVTRLYGQNRYATGAAIIEHVKATAGGTLPSSYRTMLVANGERFPDAAAGGALAYRNGHLILLSPERSAPTVALNAVGSLRTNCALLLGGTAALSAPVANQLSSELVPGGCGVDRIGGADRYETAALIASRFVQTNGPVSAVMLASDAVFTDALTAAPLAGLNRPLLLTAPNRLSPATRSWLEANRSWLNRIWGVGGPAAIAPGVLTQATDATDSNPQQDTDPDPDPDPDPDTDPDPDPDPDTDPDPDPEVSGWATSAPSPGYDYGRSVTVLSDGSAIVSGEFTGTATFGATTLTSAGSFDVFVAKVDAEGDWVWAISAEGSGYDFSWGVSALNDGSAILTGGYNGTATFGELSLTSAGGSDVFVAKVDAEGDWVWATSAGGASFDGAYGVSVLSDGSAIITGEYEGTATFGALSLTSAGDSDPFVAKVDGTGDWVWATSGGGNGYDFAYGVSVLGDGSAIITGEYEGTATFGAMSLTSSAGTYDAFVAKVGAGGTWVWATSGGGNGYDFGFGVSTFTSGPNAGSAIVTGSFSGTATFGSATLSASGPYDVFVAMVNASGVWQWAARGGSSSGATGYSVATLSDGSVIVTGRAYGPATFGSSTVGRSNMWNLVVAKVNSTGTWQWATTTGEGGGEAYGRGVSTLSDGSAIVTGYFAGDVSFGDIDLDEVDYDADLFVARISSSGSFG
jgi:putative cell wall-binding protein